MRNATATFWISLAIGILGALGDLSAKEALTPLEAVAGTPKGELRNPYPLSGGAVEEGHKLYMSLDCSSCHGGGGGGGMAAPLTNAIWIYGDDDDALFRLISLGTVEFQRQGYRRKGSEFVVGPMPPFGDTIRTADDLWKIITWIRSVSAAPKR